MPFPCHPCCAEPPCTSEHCANADAAPCCLIVRFEGITQPPPPGLEFECGIDEEVCCGQCDCFNYTHGFFLAGGGYWRLSGWNLCSGNGVESLAERIELVLEEGRYILRLTLGNDNYGYDIWEVDLGESEPDCLDWDELELVNVAGIDGTADNWADYHCGVVGSKVYITSGSEDDPYFCDEWSSVECERCKCHAKAYDAPHEETQQIQITVSGFVAVPFGWCTDDCLNFNGTYVLDLLPDVEGSSSCIYELDLDPTMCGDANWNKVRLYMDGYWNGLRVGFYADNPVFQKPTGMTWTGPSCPKVDCLDIDATIDETCFYALYNICRYEAFGGFQSFPVVRIQSIPDP